MSVLNPADLKVGDIVYGTFPADDRRKKEARHYALVGVIENGTPVIVVGTSLKDSEEVVRFGREMFVVSPKTASQHWESTGLVKPTVFDFLHGKQVKLSANAVEKADPEKVGTAIALLASYLARMKR